MYLIALSSILSSISFAQAETNNLSPTLINPVPMYRNVMRGKCPISNSVKVVHSDNTGLVIVPFATTDVRAGFHICFPSNQNTKSNDSYIGKKNILNDGNKGYFLNIGWEKTNNFFKKEHVIENMVNGDGAMFTFSLDRDDSYSREEATFITFDVKGEFLITAIDSNGDFISPTYILPQNMPIGGGAFMGRYLISLERYDQD